MERDLETQLFEPSRQVNCEDAMALRVAACGHNLGGRDTLPKIVQHGPCGDRTAVSVHIQKFFWCLPPFREFHCRHVSESLEYFVAKPTKAYPGEDWLKEPAGSFGWYSLTCMTGFTETELCRHPTTRSLQQFGNRFCLLNLRHTPYVYSDDEVAE